MVDRNVGIARISALGVKLGGVLVAVAALVACGSSEPVQSISFNQRLNMDISQQWVPAKSQDKKASYKLGEAKGIELLFEDQTRDYGSPMTVQSVRSVIGTELNLRHGGVDARVSMGGNALLAYPLSTSHGREKVYTHNWVVAKPIGYSGVVRVNITLRVPEGQQSSPEIQAMIETLDKQVGDAVVPQA